MKIFVLIILLISALPLFAQENLPAYKLFDKSGNEVSYNALINKAKDADIILFGESHNNPISHWLEFNVTKSLYKFLGNKLSLSAEMFESDAQLQLNEYLSGKISEKNFKAESKVWNNYETDYKPLVEFSKNHNLDFIASNIPRRYAALVYTKGLKYLDSLSTDALKFIVPLPFEIDTTLKCYSSLKEGMEGHKGGNLLESQAIKDATMAYFLLKYFDKNKKIIHFNGSYHSDNFEGIYWYLKKTKSNLSIVTITTVEQDDVNTLLDEDKNKADFIIVTPKDMTKTY